MSQIIAGIYEIKNKIGAGGGANVFLGEHLRLRKPVVLKADKRTLNAGEETLRREVDLLKGLSHTYIPQVYDFVQEDGNVYTVMDYIEGESLDKILRRGIRPTQPQIIRWACQLLEGLRYLHNYPPYGILHGDIKPANIMLRPNGDICLIDFNIALALGEEGAVKVGFSRGYASPEHYGTEFVRENKVVADDNKTLIDTDQTIQDIHSPVSLVRSTTNEHRTVMLDVRSDIYSLGATLYHLLSGRRPEQKASDVAVLGEEICSPAVSKIIQKAMSPNPDMRYQSAEEMLTAFRLLHKNDERAVKHRKRKFVSAVMLSIWFLIGGICTFIGLKQLEQYQSALASAEYSANALEKGDVSSAITYAIDAIPREKSILDAPVTAEAQLALTNALGVYDLSDGFKSLDTIVLPSAPFDIVVSPGEKYFAVVYAYEVAVFNFCTQQRIVELPAENSALADVIFVDDTKMIYAGAEGITAYDLEKQKILWTGEQATTLAVSADKTIIAAVNRDADYAMIYHTADGKVAAKCDFDNLHLSVPVNDIFADPQADIFCLNEDGSILAVSFSNGSLKLYDLNNQENTLVVYEESECRNFDGGFCGQFFSCTAWKNGKAVFEVIDTREADVVAGMESQGQLLLSADAKGIYLADDKLLVSIDPVSMKETELAYVEDAKITGFSIGENFTLVATDDKRFLFYDRGANLSSEENSSEVCDFTIINNKYAILGNRNEPTLRVMELKNHTEEQILSYDARYMHDEARVSQNGQTIMLFSNMGFQIYDLEGNLLAEEMLPEPENIYDQQFRRSKNDSWLEVIWYDGMRRCYSAQNGEIVSEEIGKEPAKDLYEEFFVEGYRIVSSLHSAPEVYDLESDMLVTVLEEDSYLTYVTEVGEFIITEYISASGERYGILLNQSFEKLAYLPKLCDVAENALVFDDQSGNLRQCRLYSLQELIALGETFIEKK